MKKRTSILISMIAVLVIANIYVHFRTSQQSMSGISNHNHLLDERLLLTFSERYSPAKITERNIFVSSAKSRQEQHGNSLGKINKTKIVVTQEKPDTVHSKDVDLNAQQLDLIKLLGVVDGHSRRKCYLLRQSERVIASEGDTVFGYYMVETIDVGSVTIKDLNNNLIKTIPISGK